MARDLRHVAHVPVQVDVPAVERRRGHVRVADDDQHDPDGAEPASARRDSDPSADGRRHRQHAHGHSTESSPCQRIAGVGQTFWNASDASSTTSAAASIASRALLP